MSIDWTLHCEVCSKPHPYPSGAINQTWHETELISGEVITHCPSCNPLTIRPGTLERKKS